MYVCLCVSTPEAINDWLNKFYGLYIAVVVSIVSGHGL